MPAEHKVIQSKDNQCLFDIALQEYGTIEAAPLVIADNSFVDTLLYVFDSGDRIKIRIADPAKDVAVADSLNRSRASISTIVNPEDSVLGSFDKSFNESYA